MAWRVEYSTAQQFAEQVGVPLMEAGPPEAVRLVRQWPDHF